MPAQAVVLLQHCTLAQLQRTSLSITNRVTITLHSDLFALVVSISIRIAPAAPVWHVCISHATERKLLQEVSKVSAMLYGHRSGRWTAGHMLTHSGKVSQLTPGAPSRSSSAHPRPCRCPACPTHSICLRSMQSSCKPLLRLLPRQAVSHRCFRGAGADMLLPCSATRAHAPGSCILGSSCWDRLNGRTGALSVHVSCRQLQSGSGQ